MSGVAVVLPIPLGVGRQFFPSNPPTGAVKAKNMHCTLAFLGNADEYSPADIAGLAERLRPFFRGYTPIKASVSGLGRFSNIVSGIDLYAALIDSPDLSTLRYWLVNETLSGYPIDRTHGFIPHVSLLKQRATESAYLKRLMNKEFKFRGARLWVAGKNIALPFREGKGKR